MAVSHGSRGLDIPEAIAQEPSHSPVRSRASLAPRRSVSIPWLSLTLWPKRTLSKKQYSTSQLGPVLSLKVNCNLEGWTEDFFVWTLYFTKYFPSFICN